MGKSQVQGQTGQHIKTQSWNNKKAHRSEEKEKHSCLHTASLLLFQAIKKKLEPISDFSKVAGYKINK